MPDIISFGFTDTEIFVNDLDKESVKIDPAWVQWTQSSGTHKFSLSRVTGFLRLVAAYSSGWVGYDYSCALVDKPKF